MLLIRGDWVRTTWESMGLDHMGEHGSGPMCLISAWYQNINFADLFIALIGYQSQPKVYCTYDLSTYCGVN